MNNTVQQRPDRRILSVRTRILLAIAAVCVVVGLGSFTAWAARNQAFAVGASAQQQSFVELYFTDPHNLPVEAAPGEQHSFGFTLVNRSDTARTVTYHVQLQDTVGVVNISTKTITLQPGETSRRKITYTLPQNGTTAATVVSINNKQSIRFYTQL